MDVYAELTKCEKRLDLARMGLQKINKVESQPDYVDSVPVCVRQANEEKVRFSLLNNILVPRGKHYCRSRNTDVRIIESDVYQIEPRLA